MNGLPQLRDATGGHQVGWKSPTVDDDETGSQQRGEEGQTGIEVQCRAELDIQGPPVMLYLALYFLQQFCVISISNFA